MSARAWVSVGALLLFACGSDEANETSARDAAVEAAVPDDETEFVGCPDTLSAFELGMEAAGAQGKLKAKLISASPAPPLRYLNDWTVELLDASGAPLEDATIRSARPFMPVHGHDGNVQPVVTPLNERGRFAVNGLNFNMRGPWQVQLSLRSPSAGDDDVVFEICVAE